jgi:hypothetical protein
MKQLRKFMVMAAAVLVGAVAPGRAHAQADIIKDLIAKGREAVNNFEYKTAETTAYQILAMQLSTPQRIDALELLAAATYPDDAAAQRPDSARVIITQMVTAGAQGIVTPELKWRGLDSLFTVVAATAAAAQASTSLQTVQSGAAARLAGFDSIPSIIALVAAGRPQDYIVGAVNIDCANMAFDQLDAALRRARAPGGLSDGLKRSCAKLLVETDPPNAVLTVNGQDVGPVPAQGYLRWVQPQPALELAVASGSMRIPRTVNVPQGRVLQAKFFLPRDTVALPPVRSAIQIAEELRLYENFRPSTSRPAQPVPRRGMNAFAYGMIWGILGAGAGFAAGQFLPATGCVANYTVPAGEYWRVNGQRYSGGQTVNLGGGMPCTATIAGASGLGMWTFTSLIKTGKNRGATRRYNEAVKAYPAVVKTWEDNERRSYAERNVDVRQAMADERVKLAQAQEENNAIRARNAALPEPQIFERDFTFADNPVSASAPAPASELNSDVDMRVPLAASPNADAVAIVVGNRDYTGRGTPKVEFAIRDAKSMKRYLVEAFGFSEDRVILDTNVTAGRMSELFGSANDASVSRLAELVATRPAGTVDVFVFYSGHGAPAGRPSRKYLVPVDANPARIQSNGYAIDQLYKNLTALNAKSVTVAIDAGFGALSSDMFSNESFGGGLEVEVGTVGGLNSQVLTAGTGDQSARWRRDQGHGLFTYFLLRGLQGSADANSDMTITADELQTYLISNVRTYATERLSGAVQVPEAFTSNPSRVVVQLKGGM